MEIREKIKQFIRWKHFGLTVIVITILILHFSTVYQPRELILDEQHYIPDARSIIGKHETTRTEHPPVGKLFFVAGILIFGDNPLGWRFFPIFMGTVSIILFYFICRELGMSRRSTLFATFLLAFENMSFVQSAVAMLDVYVVTFMLAAFLLYLRGDYPLSALAIALSTLSKFTGAFGALAIGLHWLMTDRTKPISFFARMMLAPLSFFIFMPIFDFVITRTFQNPFERLNSMMGQMASLTFATTTHESASRPWAWLILPKSIVMPFWYDPDYTSAVSFNLWGIIIPVFIFMLVKALKKNNAGVFGISWFIGTYLIWIPLSLITNRISFPFYFYPTVGMVCMGAGMGLSQILTRWGASARGRARWTSRLLVWGFLLSHLVVFAVMSPVFT